MVSSRGDGTVGGVGELELRAVEGEVLLEGFDGDANTPKTRYSNSTDVLSPLAQL